MRHVLVAAVATVAWASTPGATSTTQTAGGSGGTPFTMSCPAGKVLVGIRGKHGLYLDRLEGICVETSSRGAWSGSPTADGGAAGGNGGSTMYEILCPANHAVSGILGRAGQWIDALQIICRPLGRGRRLTGGSVAQPTVAGGTGGTPFGPFNCPNDEPGRGFTGRAGWYVDAIALVCEVPFVLPTPVFMTSTRETPGATFFDFTVCNVEEGATYMFSSNIEPPPQMFNGVPPDDYIQAVGPMSGYNADGTALSPPCPRNLTNSGGLKPGGVIAITRACGGDKQYRLTATATKAGQRRERSVTVTARSTGPCPGPSPEPPWLPPVCQVCSGFGIPPNPVFGYSDQWRGTCELKGPDGSNTGICKKETTCPPGTTKTARGGVWGCQGGSPDPPRP